MPQGRRKVPFSAKQKKIQLQAKKSKKITGLDGHNQEHRGNHKNADESEGESGSTVQKINKQPIMRGTKSNPNRYVLQFHRESPAQLKKQRELARQSLNPVHEKDLEYDIDDFFLSELDFPKRPEWNFNMTPQQLDQREYNYFHDYLSNIEKQFDWKDLSYFELNLETWRQLWRVLEMSDVILVIIDIRYPCLMFPPALYDYVTKTLQKDMILVLNKIDLAPAPLVLAWKHFFKSKYPKLHILCFTSYPTYNLRSNTDNEKKGKGLQVRRRRGKLRMAAEGAKKLLEACKEIVQNEVDLSSWQKKIADELHMEYDDDDDDEIEVGETIDLKKVNTDFEVHEKYRNGVLTIGCIGQPNVGKSSLMNAIMGKKVVSVSKTPGHTKYFQTIFLTKNVRLCDCPGLVFPSKVPKSLQILMGSFPIAQLREPYTAVKYLAERLDLVKLLNIRHPENDDSWSAIDICDGWALKRGYKTAKAARLDTYRGANQILRMALDGKICLCLRPPKYSDKIEYWTTHPEIDEIYWIQARTKDEPYVNPLLNLSDDDEEDMLPPPATATSEKSKPSGRDEDNDDTEEGETDEEDSEEEEGGGFVTSGNKFSLLDTSDM